MISVTEDHQRKGYGTKLLEYMEERLVELSKKSMIRYLLIELTDVSESDFYARNGYKEFSREYGGHMQKKFEFKNGELFYRLKHTEKELNHISMVMDAYRKSQEKKRNKGVQCIEENLLSQ